MNKGSIRVKKCIRDVTFEEFDKWANERACDGKWSFLDAVLCSQVIGSILNIKPLFGRKKARERAWQEIKGEAFNLDAEIEV